jgi:hypothetical protein
MCIATATVRRQVGPRVKGPPAALLRLIAVGDNAAMQTEPPKADLPKSKRSEVAIVLQQG